MNAITATKNLCLSSAKKQAAWDSNKPLQLALALPRICNAACLYCYTEQYKPLADSLGLAEIKSLLQEAVELGVETLVLPGYGEPMLHPLFWKVLAIAEGLGLYSLVFSNATLINDVVAERLAEKPVSLMIKVNSLDRGVQDRMAGRLGFAAEQQAGLSALIRAGFNRLDENGESRLAIDTLISKMTIEDVPAVVSWAVENRIFPVVETLLFMGGVLENQGELGYPEEIEAFNASVLERLNAMFPSRGHSKSTFGESCDAETYTLFLEASGHAVHCFSRREVIGQFPRDTLAEIWEKSRDERQKLIAGIDPRRGGGQGGCQACGHCQGRLDALKKLRALTKGGE